MKRLFSCFKAILFFSALISFTACSSNDGAPSISGVASKGPIVGGSVSVYKLQADGSKGDLIGTAVTGSSGLFNVGAGPYKGPVLVEVRGGTYIDEATGETRTNELLRAALPAVNGSVSLAVTPFTELAVRYAESLGGLTAANITLANQQVSDILGGINITDTKPMDVVSGSPAHYSKEAQEYGLMLAALSQAVADNPSFGNMTSLLTALSEDLADGTLDETGGDLIDALSAFTASDRNFASITSLSSMTIDDLIAEQAVPYYPEITGEITFSTYSAYGTADVIEMTIPVSKNTQAVWVHGVLDEANTDNSTTFYKAFLSDNHVLAVKSTPEDAYITVSYPLTFPYYNGSYLPKIELYDYNCGISEGFVNITSTCRWSNYREDTLISTEFYTVDYCEGLDYCAEPVETDTTLPLLATRLFPEMTGAPYFSTAVAPWGVKGSFSLSIPHRSNFSSGIVEFYDSRNTLVMKGTKFVRTSSTSSTATFQTDTFPVGTYYPVIQLYTPLGLVDIGTYYHDRYLSGTNHYMYFYTVNGDAPASVISPWAIPWITISSAK